MAIPDYTEHLYESSYHTLPTDFMPSGMVRAVGQFSVFVPGELQAVHAQPPANGRHYFRNGVTPIRWVMEKISWISVIFLNHSGLAVPLMPIYLAIKFFEGMIAAMLKIDGISDERVCIDLLIAVTNNKFKKIHSDVNVGLGYVQAVKQASTYREVNGLIMDYRQFYSLAIARYINLKDDVDTIDNFISALNNKAFGKHYKFMLFSVISSTLTLTAGFFFYEPKILPAAIGVCWIIGAVKGTLADYWEKKSDLGDFFKHEKNKKVLEILNSRRQQNSRDMEIAESGRMPPSATF